MHVDLSQCVVSNTHTSTPRTDIRVLDRLQEGFLNLLGLCQKSQDSSPLQTEDEGQPILAAESELVNILGPASPVISAAPTQLWLVSSDA